MADMTTLQERPGFRVYEVPSGPQAGRHVLRTTWLSRHDLAVLARASKAYQKQAQAVADAAQDADADLPETEEAQDIHRFFAHYIPAWDFADKEVDKDGNPKPMPQPSAEVLASGMLDLDTEAWLYSFNEGGLWADAMPKKATSARS